MSSSKEVSSASTAIKSDVVYIVTTNSSYYKEDTKYNNKMFTSSYSSDYKEDAEYNKTFAFSDETKARKFMRDSAKNLFYDFIHIEWETVCEEKEESKESNDDSEKPAEDPRSIRERTPTDEGRGSCLHFFY